MALAIQRQDPTRTTTIRQEYARHLRSLFDEVMRQIRVGLVENDALAIQQAPGPRDFDFPTDSAKVDAFESWLQGAIDEEILSAWDGENFIRQGAGKGIEHADTELARAGIDPGDSDVVTILRQPVHRDKLELMFTRNFDELEGITSAMEQQLERELSEGLASGVGPDEIARNMSERVDGIKRNRANTMARTEVIRAHSEFTLDRYEQIAGDIEVTIVAEFSTALDDRVCPMCEELEGSTYSISEMRSATFQPEVAKNRAVSEFPVQPPVHPNCRCAILPRIDRSAAQAVAQFKGEAVAA